MGTRSVCRIGIGDCMDENCADHARVWDKAVPTTSDLSEFEQEFRVQGVAETKSAYANVLCERVRFEECLKHSVVTARRIDVGHAVCEDEESRQSTRERVA